MADLSPITFDDRLLAEATAAFESIADETDRDARRQAAQVAREAADDFESRIVIRAQHLPESNQIRAAVGHVRRAVFLLAAIGCLLALLAGAGAARAALGGSRETPINFFWVLLSLLGVQTILLLVWFVAMIVRPRRAPTFSLGGLFVALGQILSRWTGGTAHHAAAIRAMAGAYTSAGFGRWSISAISHACWAAFNIGAIVLVLLLLSAKQYTFGWETTILSAETYTPLTESIAEAPRRLGFRTPDAEQIAASQWDPAAGKTPDDSDAAKAAWSGLLVGALAVYGFAPRVVLFVISWLLRLRAMRCYRLDTDDRRFAVLRPELTPPSRTLGVVDPSDDKDAAIAAVRPAPDERPLGPPALIGYEIEPPQTGWPPPTHGVRLTDLGLIDTRNDRRDLLELLTHDAKRPARVIVCCAITTTPDRGVASFLKQIRAASAAPLALLLTGGERMRKRAPASDHQRHLQRRLDDWRRLAHDLDIPDDRITEIDLDHATETSLAKLGRLLTGEEKRAGAVRRIEAAFETIVEHASSWSSSPTEKQQQELHRAIANVYRDASRDWKQLFALPDDVKDVQQLGATLKTNAQRMTQMLPPRLRNSPKWLAAGALAGGIGCIAAASLISPIAIAALPTWAALGAGSGGLVQFLLPEKDETVAETVDDDAFAEAIRAATLFALLLECQGRDETEITRVIDETLTESLATQPFTNDNVAVWLNDVRHNYDLAGARTA